MRRSQKLLTSVMVVVPVIRYLTMGKNCYTRAAGQEERKYSHPAAHGGPHIGTGGCALKEFAA